MPCMDCEAFLSHRQGQRFPDAADECEEESDGGDKSHEKMVPVSVRPLLMLPETSTAKMPKFI